MGINMDEKVYYNVICEEIGTTGGKIIHVDENRGTIREVHDLVEENIEKYPNAKWELYQRSLKYILSN